MLQAVVHEQGLMSEYRRLRGAGRRPPQAPDQQPQQQPQRERGEEGQVVQPQAHGKHLYAIMFFFLTTPLTTLWVVFFSKSLHCCQKPIK